MNDPDQALGKAVWLYTGVTSHVVYTVCVCDLVLLTESWHLRSKR